MERSDHDLLISLDTRMEMVLNRLDQLNDQWMNLVGRVTSIEIEQSRHKTEIENLEEELTNLKKKATTVDVVNGVAAALAGAIGYFFGGK